MFSITGRLCVCALFVARANADSIPVQVLDPNLQVTTALSTGITQPIGIVFLSASQYFVLEKASGQVKLVVNGVIQPNPVLDLPVNSASERGLLSMVLHPNFSQNRWVYIRWTVSSTGSDMAASGEKLRFAARTIRPSRGSGHIRAARP